MLYIVNKARQNRAFASVTSKIRRADFPVRADWGEVLRQKFFVCYLATCRKTRGKPQRSGLGFPLKDVSAKCFA